MAFTAKTRYGSMERYEDDAAIPSVVESLIRELETEQYNEPDDEHYQVAIAHGDWVVTVEVYGLMILNDMRELPGGGVTLELFKRAASRQEAADLLGLMARGEIAAVQAAGWVPRDQAPPWERDLFRLPTAEAEPMTEAKWLACARPHLLLAELEWQGTLSPRKQQLFYCACVKRIGRLLVDERLRAGVVARDMYADDLVTTHQLRAAQAAAQQAKAEIPLPPEFGQGIDGIVPAAAVAWAADAAVAVVEGPGSCGSVLVTILEAVRCEASGDLQEPVTHEWVNAFNAKERAAQTHLVRDVFGNPFRPDRLNPSWITATVANLAESIYQDEGFDRMPILADALEDAGCTAADVLDHCRGPGPHVRGCWVIDRLLGKK